MRFTILAVVPLVLAFASFTSAHSSGSDLSLEAREYIDELTAREILSEVSTRELLDHLSARLERRGGICTKCGKQNVQNKGKPCRQNVQYGHVV
ncbi:hypothetical protein DFP72DRAFT_947902 [Ephemerocybe angulata]|uniref:Uncharacterized protein n=1 Tax=Ephemerocybe angulata TaxID=980116 RepID=A0A8H6H7K0_9AGAR|nr:hypothetical protein DFP72DRAFT_947902 [Tulosesus angulatus]